MKRLVIASLALFSALSLAKPVQLYIDMGTEGGAECSVQNLGYRFNSIVQYQGQKKDIFGTDSCIVEVSNTDFKKNFSMCFITSVKVDGQGRCAFNIFDGGNDFHSFSAFGTGVKCRFTCID